MYLIPGTKGVKVDFPAAIGYQTSGYFGCSSLALSNLHTLATIREDKEKELTPPYNVAGANMVPVGKAGAAITAWLATEEPHLLRFETLRKTLASAYSLIIMSGVCYDAEGNPQVDNLRVPSSYYYGSVAHFAKWLRSIGEPIMATPLLANQFHLVPSVFSLRRGWFWMPNKDGHTGVKFIQGTEYAANLQETGRLINLGDFKKKYPHLRSTFDPAKLLG